MEIKSRHPDLKELQEYIWWEPDGVCDCLALDDRFTPMEASMFAAISEKLLSQLSQLIQLR